ncbi:MAG: MFS transporter, partial [Bacteroidales bacterium]|nr:MFS transporter [Bacteroidales bacterium]
GIVFPTFQAMINNLVEPWRRGAANSTLFTALDLGIGTGAVVTGYLASLVGLSEAFGALAATSICGLLLYFLIAQPHYLRHTRQ